MRIIVWCYGVILTLLLLTLTVTSFALVIPTANKNINVYLGLFGSDSNPAQQTGCYYPKNNVLNAKQFLEYNYTAMNCLDNNGKTITSEMTNATSLFMAGDTDDLIHYVFLRASAIQLGLNFIFNS